MIWCVFLRYVLGIITGCIISIYKATDSRMGDIWQEICDELGIHYIDARRPIHEIIQEIAETEVLLAEAMHGAITADTLRTPWIPVMTSQWLLPSTWIDWTLSLNMEFQPHPITGLDTIQERYKLKKIKGIKGSRTILKKSMSRWIKKEQAKLQNLFHLKLGLLLHEPLDQEGAGQASDETDSATRCATIE